MKASAMALVPTVMAMRKEDDTQDKAITPRGGRAGANFLGRFPREGGLVRPAARTLHATC